MMKELDFMYKEAATKNQELLELKKAAQGKGRITEEYFNVLEEREKIAAKVKILEEEKKMLKKMNDKMESHKKELEMRAENLNRQNNILASGATASVFF